MPRYVPVHRELNIRERPKIHSWKNAMSFATDIYTKGEAFEAPRNQHQGESRSGRGDLSSTASVIDFTYQVDVSTPKIPSVLKLAQVQPCRLIKHLLWLGEWFGPNLHLPRACTAGIVSRLGSSNVSGLDRYFNWTTTETPLNPLVAAVKTIGGRDTPGANFHYLVIHGTNNTCKIV